MRQINTNAVTWFDGAKRVVFVHAHPDDETIATGGTLAGLTAAGKPAGVITLTRGERGEVTPGLFSGLQGTEGLAPHREQELAAALLMLGVQDHAYLGTAPARSEAMPDRVYEDSGMAWDESSDDASAIAAPDTGPAALTSAPATELVNDLLYGVLSLECDAVVSYNDEGGYGHPDHVLAHRAARAVAAAIEVPFWEIVPGSTTEVHENADTSGDEDSIEAYDVLEWKERKIGALRMHGTQLNVLNDEVIEHVGGQRQQIEWIERFRKLNAPSL